MNFKTFFALGGLLFLASTALVTTSTGCDQPAPKCASSRGDYVVRYTFVSGPESCKDRIGEKVGLQTYNATGKENKPDLDKSSVAIQADGIGSLRDKYEGDGVTDANEADKAYAYGAFNTATPQGNVCIVSTLTTAQQNLDAVPNEDGGAPLSPKASMSYVWSNVQFLVTAQYYGSQFQADVTVNEDGAACSYRAQGLYPYVDCTKVDAAGDPVLDAAGKPQVDESTCAAEANPPAHPTGSGINPDFAVHCDPVLFACVLNSTTFPSIR